MKRKNKLDGDYLNKDNQNKKKYKPLGYILKVTKNKNDQREETQYLFLKWINTFLKWIRPFDRQRSNLLQANTQYNFQ